MLQYCFFLLFFCSTLLQAQSSLIPYRKGDKWGFADSSGKIVIPCKYEDAMCFAKATLAPVKKKGKYGYINAKGIIVIRCHYDEAGEFDTKGRAFVTHGKVGWYIDSVGRSTASPVAMDFADVVMSVGYSSYSDSIEGKRGYHFYDGTKDIPAIYDSVSLEAGNYDLRDMKLLWVKNNGKVGILSFDNRVIVPLQYEVISVNIYSNEPSKQIFVTQSAGLYGFFGGTGIQICPPKYKSVGRFSWGLCRVTTVNGKEGYIDERGKEYWED